MGKISGCLKEGGIWTKAMLVHYKEMCHMIAAIHRVVTEVVVWHTYTSDVRESFVCG